jgi:hypothetical protein
MGHVFTTRRSSLTSSRTGVHPEITEAWLQAVAAGPEHLAVMRGLAFRSMVNVPLRPSPSLNGHSSTGRSRNARGRVGDWRGGRLVRRCPCSALQARQTQDPTPFPASPHQTVHAVFPHTAFQDRSPRRCRRCRRPGHGSTEVVDAKRTEEVRRVDLPPSPRPPGLLLQE